MLDPLQPLCALDLNVPENAQFVCSQLSALAAATGAAVIVSHHFAKREASTPEQAREAIRGTGGLVDGVRCVYAIWLPKEDHAKSICEKLGITYQRNLVVQGGVVKANGRANLQVSTYIRSDSGLLVDRTSALRMPRQDDEPMLRQLAVAVARAASRAVIRHSCQRIRQQVAVRAIAARCQHHRLRLHRYGQPVQPAVRWQRRGKRVQLGRYRRDGGMIGRTIRNRP